ncbi:MAG: putative DNA modification/repair radical SAM protein [Euryarchaeota archaeon]|nr:putative DNA modification/repair radical SAM protein [Euryarchaeota archaeon]
MNYLEKLNVLTDSAKYDLCNYVTSSLKYNAEEVPALPGIYYSTSSSGCCVPLFKVLMSNKCSNDCKYCINHSNRKFKRVEFTPKELTSIFLDYYNKKYVEGLFLSSGTSREVDSTMEKMIEVSSALRNNHDYNGYIHLKILPGTSYELIKRAMSLADRVSVNIEAATPGGFDELTTTKNYKIDIIRRMKWINRLTKKHENYAPSGQTTQFIVGATEESDEEILNRANWLSDKFDIKRNYFSAFTPIEDTPLENHGSPHPKRVSRLYQAEFLIKSYGFDFEELIFDENGNMATEMDPKYSIALFNRDMFPVEINQASYKELLRVPGIGKISATRIISAKNNGNHFEKLEELKKMGVMVKRAEPFIKLKGTYQSILSF